MRHPRAVWRPLGRQSEPPMTAHDIVCAHTMVGSLLSSDRYFRDVNGPGYEGTEAHYGVGGAWGDDVDGGPGGSSLDGVLWQWQDRLHQADAVGEGNPRVLSIETADNAPRKASDIRPWTPLQVLTLVEVIVWECSLPAHADCPAGWACRRGVDWRGVRVAIPPVLIPDTKPGRRGLAVHRQGVKHSQGVGKVPGWLVPGGETWSDAVGKECPGGARVAQFTAVVIPEVQRRILAGPQAPEEDDVKASDELELLPYLKTLLGRDKASVGELWQHAAAQGIAANRVLATVVSGLGDARTALEEIVTNDGLSRDERIALAQEIAAMVDRVQVTVTQAAATPPAPPAGG